MSETMWAVIADKDQPLRIGEAERPACGTQDVLIAVEATGLNRADLVQRAGFYPPPPGASPIIGLECSGTIVETGSEVSGWAVGDRVCALMAGGAYAEFAVAHQGSLFRMPDTMSFNEAAALPEAMMTVWANIYDRCAFQPGETLLMHGGTSGIGSMAIQMAKHSGAGKIITTVGSAGKAAAATGFGADVVINYREQDFLDIVQSEGGADVTLDMVGGEYVEKNIAAAKLGGRICNIAYMQGHKVELSLMPLMLKRLILTGTTLRARPNDDKQRIRDAILAGFWPAILDGTIKPVIDTVYPFSDADAAQAHMAKGGHIGKILLSQSAS